MRFKIKHDGKIETIEGKLDIGRVLGERGYDGWEARIIEETRNSRGVIDGHREYSIVRSRGVIEDARRYIAYLKKNLGIEIEV